LRLGASAIQLGVEAIRRGETDAALCMGTDGSINPEALPLLAAVRAVDQHDNPQAAIAAILQEPGRLHHGGKAPARWCWKVTSRRSRAAPRFWASWKAAGEMTDAFHRTRSGPDGKPDHGCMANALRMPGCAADIDYVQRRLHLGTPENDKMECLGVTTVSASA